MDLVKVAGVTNWLMPECKKDVQQFLSFTNFYRRFIKVFSDAARPLFNLTGKHAPWIWTELEATAFQAIKDAVTREPVLVLPDESKPYRREPSLCDRSGTAHTKRKRHRQIETEHISDPTLSYALALT
jgi:hypothetical protein